MHRLIGQTLFWLVRIVFATPSRERLISVFLFVPFYVAFLYHLCFNNQFFGLDISSRRLLVFGLVMCIGSQEKYYNTVLPELSLYTIANQNKQRTCSVGILNKALGSGLLKCLKSWCNCIFSVKYTFIELMRAKRLIGAAVRRSFNPW